MKQIAIKMVFLIVLNLALIGCISPGKKVSELAPGTSKFQLRDFKETTLKNGLKVLFVEDRHLPYVNFSVLVNSGYASDPKGKSGLTSFAADLLDKGTSKRSAAQIADDLEQLGMNFETSTEADYSFIKITALSWNEDKALENLSEMIIDPAFSQNEIDRHRQQVLSALQKKVDEPSEYAQELFYSYFYGNHPYGRPGLGKINEVKAIKRKDLISHYIKFFNPTHSWLVVTGQYSPEIQTKLESYFERWKDREQGILEFPKLDQFKGTHIRLVDNSSLVQTQMYFGHPGISRKIPEYLEVKVANSILGDGFSSRLVKSIRVKQGLTYTIDSEFDTKKDQGVFFISTFTKNKTAGQMVSEVLKTYKEFYEKGVTEEEVQAGKSYLTGMFPQVVETPERFAYNLLVLRVFGVSDSYLYDFQKNIQKVTAKKVNAAIKKYFDPDDLKILVYSSKADVLKQLEPLGHVEVLNAKAAN